MPRAETWRLPQPGLLTSSTSAACGVGGDPQEGLMGTHPLQVLSCPFPGPPRALRYSPEGAGFRVRLDRRAQLCPLLTEETREHFPLREMRLWGSYLKGIG